jgi:N-acetylmuramoyl-L-alanine amidase
MKYLRYTLVLWCFLHYGLVTLAETLTIPQQDNREFNRLNWVEVSNGSFSTQIIFDFAHPIYFKKKLIKDKLELRLSFPGMHLSQFDTNQILPKLNRLKELGFVQKIDIFEKNKEKSPKVSKVIVTLDFSKNREVKTKDNKIEVKKNNLLIKWCKLDDPHRLIFDIFTKESLDKLKNSEKLILYAYNDTIRNDFSFFETHKTSTASALIDCPVIQNLSRIVVDAGHGGTDDGAKKFGLKEKDLTLDIAKLVHKQLKKEGFHTLLTRSSDTELSRTQRTELAQQFKADLFVSIHINSDPLVNQKHEGRASGLETYYLNTNNLIAPTRHGGFLFINLDNNQMYPTAVDNFLKNNACVSQKLALTLQKSILSTLKKNNIPITNRGIKSDQFLVLLRSPVPAALVEVGFITNKIEAQRLASVGYRKLIAQGICSGIKEYITTQQH